ncbi:MAG: sugar kinase [Anaerolineales bacterium]|nr:sugar kinase [Anaerolineales bacterium]
MKFDILVAGELNPDLILDDPELDVSFGQVETLVRDAELTIGSSSAIFACQAARLGLRTAFIGVVGDDLFGRFMLDSLSERGVDVTACIVNPELHTGFSVILSRSGDRAILTHPGAIAALRADQLSETQLKNATHLHVASFFLQQALQPGLKDLFAHAQSLHLTTSLDTNWDPGGHWESVQEILPCTNVFFPNENEALALTGAADAEQAVAQLAGKIPIVALKLGAEGALMRAGTKTQRLTAPHVSVVDTVGAGDSFDAGFLFGYLKGWPLMRALELAVACGSLSVQARGGTAGQPNLETALQYIQQWE